MYSALKTGEWLRCSKIFAPFQAIAMTGDDVVKAVHFGQPAACPEWP